MCDVVRVESNMMQPDYNPTPVSPGSTIPVGGTEVKRSFFDLCDEINSHLDEGNGIAESIIGMLPNKPKDVPSNLNEVASCSIDELGKRLQRIVSKATNLTKQLQRIESNF